MALALVTVVFALPRAVPLDTAEVAQLRGGAATPAEAARLRRQYGLDRPLVEQYRRYLARLAHGDLGESTSRNEPVRSVLGARLPWTLLVSGLALALGSLVSYLAGVAVAWRRGERRDRVLLGVMAALGVVPEYATAFVLLGGLAVLVPVFPLAGARTPFATYPSVLAGAADVGYHLVLPVAALTLGLMTSKFLLVRNSMLGVLGEDYMVLARAKGLPERTMKHHHAGRNAILPFLTALGFEVGLAVSGSIFVERAFAYPGVAGVLTDAFALRDYPLIEGGFLLLAGTVLAANMAVEVAYAQLDPRARAS